MNGTVAHHVWSNGYLWSNLIDDVELLYAAGALNPDLRDAVLARPGGWHSEYSVNTGYRYTDSEGSE